MAVRVGVAVVESPVQREVMIPRDDNFQFCVDGIDQFKGSLVLVHPAVASQVAAVDQHIGGGEWRLEGDRVVEGTISLPWEGRMRV